MKKLIAAFIFIACGAVAWGAVSTLVFSAAPFPNRADSRNPVQITAATFEEVLAELNYYFVEVE